LVQPETETPLYDRIVVKRIEEQEVLPTLADPIRYSPVLEAILSSLIHSVKEQGLEGSLRKRRDRKYEPGLRSGAWMKCTSTWDKSLS
jgi:ATP-dependent DNA ligase